MHLEPWLASASTESEDEDELGRCPNDVSDLRFQGRTTRAFPRSRTIMPGDVQRVFLNLCTSHKHLRRVYHGPVARIHCHDRHRPITTSGNFAVPGHLLSMEFERPFFISHGVVPCSERPDLFSSSLNPIRTIISLTYTACGLCKRVLQALSYWYLLRCRHSRSEP